MKILKRLLGIVVGLAWIITIFFVLGVILEAYEQTRTALEDQPITAFILVSSITISIATIIRHYKMGFWADEKETNNGSWEGKEDYDE